MKAHYQPAATMETLLYGCKKEDPDHMEEILYQCKGYINKEELMQKGKQWADQNGYNRLRLREINLNQKPDFREAINI